MIEKFCYIANIDEDVEQILLKYQRDDVLIDKMRIAIKNQDREMVVSISIESQELYGSLYPLLLFSYSLDIIRSFFPSDEIFCATLSDFSIWLSNFKRDRGTIGLGNLNWLSLHVTGSLMRIGRLQAEITKNEYVEGEILSLHIPQGESLAPDKVDTSLALIKKQFPNFDRAYCFSWLLDPALKLVLDEKSNILSFQSRFELFKIPTDYGKQTFERVFFTGATKNDVLNFEPKNLLQKKIQQEVRKGTTFSHYGGFIIL